MRKFILAPIVLGMLVSAVITGCSGGGSDKDSGAKQSCEYKIDGGNAVDILLGTTYKNPEIKVIRDGKIVSSNLTGTVNTNKLGTYEMTYKGDSCGNSQIRKVSVVSSVTCGYKLAGANPLELTFGASFSEPGFEVKDNNKEIVQGIATGTVDTSKIGEYSVTYKGNGCSNTETRIVKITEGSCSYTLIGKTQLTLKQGDTYTELGASVKDIAGRSIVGTPSGIVNTTKVGSYTITYKGAGCSNTEKRVVTVEAASGACTYNLSGANPLEITVGDSYQELGASIKGADNQTVTGETSGVVDTTTIGSYSIIYKSDRCTNTARRTVKVVSADCTYTLKGNIPLLLDKGDTFVDPGVEVKDASGKVVTSISSGNVDNAVLGDYTLTYQGKDCANSQTRSVTVKMQTCEYKLLAASPLEIILNSAYTDSGAEVKDKKGIVLAEKLLGTGNVDSTKVGEYVVTYKLEACGNSKDRIVKVRALTNDELRNTILPGL